MDKPPYEYKREVSTRYLFLSTGKRPVEKIVVFTALEHKKFYNLGFGDLMPNGEIDDKANTNNGDIIKVLSTIIHIVKHFTENNREAKIAFKGSTKERTALYQRILMTYFEAFRKEFVITALKGPINSPVESLFDPRHEETYLAFFVKRKS